MNKSIHVPSETAKLLRRKAVGVTEFVTNRVTESDAPTFKEFLQKDAGAISSQHE